MDLNEMLDVMEINCEFEALFTNERINHKDINQLGLFVYDVRFDDDCYDFCTIENSVMVNHAGSLIMTEELPIPETGYLELNDDDFNFTGDFASVNDLL